MMRFLIVLLAVISIGPIRFICSQEKAETKKKTVVRLEEFPVNRWVNISTEKTGVRTMPIFVYAKNIKKFIVASGIQARGGIRPRHYDTEEFDLKTSQWANAYPLSLSKGRPVSGPVGKEYSKGRASTRVTWRTLLYKDGAFLRLGAGGQWLTTRMEYEWTYVPENGKVYTYIFNRTISYDPVTRIWQELMAKPRTKCTVWGSLSYDPINKELLHSGGDGGSADVSTWVYSLKNNTWAQLDFGTKEMKGLGLASKELLWKTRGLMGACSNRFSIAETIKEEKADLTKLANSLKISAIKLKKEFVDAKLSDAEKLATKVAINRIEIFIADMGVVGPKLSGKLNAEILSEVRAIQTICEQISDALAVEPPGRARSQTAYDPVSKKIILFGGDGLDRVLSDTWLYDCQSKKWEQKFPKYCPKPRAGHIMAWLPKAKKIVLAGGYSRTWLAQEIWTYDVSANEWGLLLHLPLKSEEYGRKHYSQNCPRINSRGTQVGAVNEDDVLVCLGTSLKKGWGRITWASKIDPSKVDKALSKKHSVASGSYTFSSIAPKVWEKVANPDGVKTKKFYEEMPFNQWTALSFPKYAPGASNRWGSTAYDSDRHQFLFWGGGHSTSVENDVSHFSVRGGMWSLGYHPDDPIDIRYATMPNVMGYRNNVNVPMHAYKTYCYDTTSKRMLYFDRAYDPARHTWNPIPFPGLVTKGCLGTFLEPTSLGVVAYSSKGLFRFDAKEKKWNRLPWKGPAFGAIYGDGHSLCYDSKRNCLWLSKKDVILNYDLSTGVAVRLDVKKPKALGGHFLWREQVYLPKEDLILLMRLFKRPNGKLENIVWNPSDKKFYWVNLTYRIKDTLIDLSAKKPKVRFSWHSAIQYDEKLNLILLNNSSRRMVWALKFNKKKVLMEEIKVE